jgi:hypothetical protein
VKCPPAPEIALVLMSYIASTCTGGRTYTPGVTARARYAQRAVVAGIDPIITIRSSRASVRSLAKRGVLRSRSSTASDSLADVLSRAFSISSPAGSRSSTDFDEHEVAAARRVVGKFLAIGREVPPANLDAVGCVGRRLQRNPALEP